MADWYIVPVSREVNKLIYEAFHLDRVKGSSTTYIVLADSANEADLLIHQEMPELVGEVVISHQPINSLVFFGRDLKLRTAHIGLLSEQGGE